MRSFMIIVLISLFSLVLSKSNGKPMTDTMGQQIIEITGPKELPPGLEEEPGVESDDDDPLPAPAAATKKDSKKTTTTTLSETRKNMKDIEKIDGPSSDDEETRLEKELAEIYRDTDYKDSSEDLNESKEITTVSTAPTMSEDIDKPIGRSNNKNSFKFAPDTTNKKDIEKFRTSVDDINCKNRQKLSATSAPNKALGKIVSDKSDTMKQLNTIILIAHLSAFVILI